MTIGTIGLRVIIAAAVILVLLATSLLGTLTTVVLAICLAAVAIGLIV